MVWEQEVELIVCLLTEEEVKFETFYTKSSIIRWYYRLEIFINCPDVSRRFVLAEREEQETGRGQYCDYFVERLRANASHRKDIVRDAR